MTWYISAGGNDTKTEGRSPGQPCKSLPYLLNVVNPAQNQGTQKILKTSGNITEKYEKMKKIWTEDITNEIELNEGKCEDLLWIRLK